MEENDIIKIRDSVDLFLSNGRYLIVYYIGTRQRRCFRVNNQTIHLLKLIDGKTAVREIIAMMVQEEGVSQVQTLALLEALLKTRVVSVVVRKQTLLSEEELNRYNRQINYFSEFLDGEFEGICAQRRLKDSTVLVFGCGAVGGDIALQLAMAGVGNLILFDGDVVEAPDVARHMFFRRGALGKRKVDALKEEILRINSNAHVECLVNYLTPETPIEKLVQRVDFVVNTLDEPYIGYTASKISRVCVRHLIPHYIAGGFDAHLASTGELIIPYVTPCVECYATHFKKTLRGWKPRQHPVAHRFNEIGGLASLSLFSASYACIEIIKLLAGLENMAETYKIRGEFLFHDMSLTYLDVQQNPQCPICGSR